MTKEYERIREYENKKLEIYKEFPELFNGEPYCGFSIGLGWFALIRNLCLEISKEINKLPEEFRNFTVAQVKEKFAGLRFYYDGPDQNFNEEIDSDIPEPEILNEVREKISQLVSAAEKESFNICESCGKPGQTRNDGWMKTQCNECEIHSHKQKEINRRKIIVRLKAEQISGLDWIEYNQISRAERLIINKMAEKEIL